MQQGVCVRLSSVCLSACVCVLRECKRWRPTRANSFVQKNKHPSVILHEISSVWVFSTRDTRKVMILRACVPLGSFGNQETREHLCVIVYSSNNLSTLSYFFFFTSYDRSMCQPFEFIIFAISSDLELPRRLDSRFLNIVFFILRVRLMSRKSDSLANRVLRIRAIFYLASFITTRAPSISSSFRKKNTI